MKNGKLVFPPVTPFVISVRTDRGCFLTQTYEADCIKVTDLLWGPGSLNYNSFWYWSCSGVEQAACGPFQAGARK